MSINPTDTVEVAVEQRIFGLFAAAKTLNDLSRKTEGREVIARPKCIEDIELVRDALSRILDRVGGK